MIFEFKTVAGAQMIVHEINGITYRGQVITNADLEKLNSCNKIFAQVQGYKIAIIFFSYNGENQPPLLYLIDVLKTMANWYLENKIEPNKSYYKRYLDK
jgi:hypothetical protein